MVYFKDKNINNNIKEMLMGISGGIMLSATIFSLIIPSVNYSNSYITCLIGIFLGYSLFIIINKFTNKTTYLAITIHNIPEGICIGLIFASFLITNNFNSSIILSIGIALQNIPEGAITSIPLYTKGYSKTKSFLKGVNAALVELIFSLITLLFKKSVMKILPYSLSFAAGTMLYSILNDAFKKQNSFNINIGFIIGFTIMTFIDFYLG